MHNPLKIYNILTQRNFYAYSTTRYVSLTSSRILFFVCCNFTDETVGNNTEQTTNKVESIKREIERNAWILLTHAWNIKLVIERMV